MQKSASSIARMQGTALHRQLFLVLKDQILRGVYTRDTALPNEETLGKLFGVSRITVRHALKDLDEQGYVERRRGSGSYVREGVSTMRPPANLSYLESMALMASATKVKVLRVETCQPPMEVVSQLQLELHVKAVHALRVRKVGTVPMMLVDAWSPREAARNVTAAALRVEPLYQLLIQAGVTPTKVVQEMSAVAADPEIARHLECEVSAPVLRITRLLYDANLQPVQYKVVHVTSERTRVLATFGSESLDRMLSGGHFVHNLSEGPSHSESIG